MSDLVNLWFANEQLNRAESVMAEHHEDNIYRVRELGALCWKGTELFDTKEEAEAYLTTRLEQQIEVLEEKLDDLEYETENFWFFSLESRMFERVKCYRRKAEVDDPRIWYLPVEDDDERTIEFPVVLGVHVFDELDNAYEYAKLAISNEEEKLYRFKGQVERTWSDNLHPEDPRKSL